MTVLIVDDHAAFRSSAKLFLTGEGYEVVGEAGDGRSGLDAALALSPDLVLLDVELPDITGFEVAERLAAGANPPAVVLVSGRDARSYGGRVARSPARGFIPKNDLSGARLAGLLGGSPTAS